MMSTKLLLLAVACLVATSYAHTWTLSPPSRTTDTSQAVQDQPWQPDKGPCSKYKNTSSTDPNKYNALNPRVTEFVKAGDDLAISWYDEHSGAWPNCSDESQYLKYYLMENPAAPDESTKIFLGHGCGSTSGFSAKIPDTVQSGTYTVQMVWRYNAQAGANGGSVPTFYSCSDIDVSGREDNENLDSSNTISGRVLSVLPFLAPLGIIPAMIACALARQHKRESVRLTRMTQMSGTGSMYADVAAGRGAGAAAGGERSTMMSGVSVLSADSAMSSGSGGVRATGVTAMTHSSGQRASGGSRGSRGSAGRSRSSSGGKRSSGKRSSGGSRGSRGSAGRH